MSGCYSCGSSEGNEARLCPRCVARRLQKISTLSRPAPESRSVHRNYLYGLALLAAGLLIAVGVVDQYASLTQEPAETGSPEALYDDCKRATRRIARFSGDIPAKAVVAGMAVGICDQMQRVCTANPKGEECRKARSLISSANRRWLF